MERAVSTREGRGALLQRSAANLREMERLNERHRAMLAKLPANSRGRKQGESLARARELNIQQSRGVLAGIAKREGVAIRF
jgi:hypothetical protein